jgi:O-antigen/teichoic acid export membrane protein
MLSNILSNWFGLFVLGVISVILTPAMIHGLGNVSYGMWALAGSLLDYSGLLDMGMRATLFRYVAYFRGANQRTGLNQTFATGIAISLFAMCLCGSVFVGLAFILPAFFKFAGAEKATFSWVILLMGASVSLALPAQFLSAYLRGLERFDLYNLGLIAHGIFRGGLLLTLLKMGFGIVPVAIGVLASEVFFVALHSLLVKRADPRLEVSFDHLTWKQTREMCNFGFYSFVNNSGETLRYSTDSFVIGRMLNVALVTPFSIATRLTEYFRTLSGGLSGPVMVRLSELSGGGREDELREEFLRTTRFCMLFSLLIGGLLIVDGKTLIQLWMGPNFESSYRILIVLTVGYIVMFGQVPCQLLIFARANYHKALGWLTLVEGAANLALSIFWARRYGLIGVALGTSVPLIVSKLLIQPWFAMKDLKLSAWSYFINGVARPLVAGGAFMACSWLLVSNALSSPSLLRFASSCIVQAFIFVAVTFLFGMSQSDRRELKQYGGRMASSVGIRKGGTR